MRAFSRIRACQRAGRSGVLVYELLLVCVVLACCWLGVCQIVGASRAPTSQTIVSEKAIVHLKLGESDRFLGIYRRNDDVNRLDLESGEASQIPVFVGHDVLRVAQSGDGQSTLISYIDGTSTLVSDGCERLSYQRPPTKCAMASVVSNDGHVALDVTDEGHIHGWRRRDQSTAEFEYDLPTGARIIQIFLDLSGNSLCVARGDGVITFHDPESGLTIRNPLSIGCCCSAFACLPDQSKLAAFVGGDRIHILDLKKSPSTWVHVIEKSKPFADVVAMEFSGDGRWLAISTSLSSEISLLDTDCQQSAGRLQGHQGIVRALQFTSDSKRLISGGLDGTIREWSLNDRKQRREIVIPGR